MLFEYVDQCLFLSQNYQLSIDEERQRHILIQRRLSLGREHHFVWPFQMMFHVSVPCPELTGFEVSSPPLDCGGLLIHS